MSIVEKMFNSRVWNAETGFDYQSDFVELVKEVEACCEKLGVTLSRWQTNHGNHATTISYAVHTGERYEQYRRQPDETVLFGFQTNNIEGKTRKCEAGRELSIILRRLQKRIEMMPTSPETNI